MADPVLLRFEGPVAVLTLNNPKRINAFGLAMREAFCEHLLELHADDQCRAIVLTGAGGHFCSGGDISEMEQRDILPARMRMDLPTRIFKLLVAGPKPVVSAVEGNAFGCGVSLAAASDYAVAAADAKFSCAFIKVGLIPDHGGIWSIARRVGHRKAMEMCAFGDVYSAEQALKMELVNRICEPRKALGTAIEAAQRFAANPPVAMALLKSALNRGGDTIDQAIATETDFLSLLQTTEDFGEAAAAFREKRKPKFTGR